MLKIESHGHLSFYERVFVYGTLMYPDNLMNLIGRLPHAEEDHLEGFTKGKVQLGDVVYAILIPADHSSVSGLVLLVESSELKLLDDYKTTDYRRIKVCLSSGRHAWVYVSPDYDYAKYQPR